MPVTVRKKEEAVISTTKSKTGVVEETNEERIEGYSGDARIGVGKGFTHHLGDNNYVKFNVYVELPCAPEQIHNAFNIATNIATEKMDRLGEELIPLDGGDNG